MSGSLVGFYGNSSDAKIIMENSVTRVKKLKGIHNNDRCFILGTGPSINTVDFSLLKNEILIGVNKANKLEQMYDVSINYFCVSDFSVFFDDVITQEIFKPSKTTVFLSLSARGWYLGNISKLKSKGYTNEPICLTNSKGLRWSTNIEAGTGLGYTVVVDTALPVACYMGFKKIYLLGVDQNYQKGIHYFDGTYNRDINRVNINLNRAKQKWEEVNKQFEKAGVDIINCSEESKLDVFKKEKLIKIFLESGK